MVFLWGTVKENLYMIMGNCILKGATACVTHEDSFS
jgi:hypothetical protein